MLSQSRRSAIFVLLGFAFCLFLSALGASAQDAKKQAKVDDKAIQALIAQLGDIAFEKREAAHKRLAEIGESALAILQMAVKENADPEVRYRAQQLANAIQSSFFVQVRRFDAGENKGGGPWSNRVAVTRDGRFAVATSLNGLRCWEIATGKEGVVFDWPKSSSYSWSVALSQDDQLVLTGSTDRVARVLDMKTGKLVQKLEGHGGNVWAAALMPNGKEVVSGALDQTIRIWDLASGKQVRAFENVRDHVRCMAVSPDGKLLAAGHFMTDEEPGVLRIWDLASGKEMHAMEGHTLPISSVAFSPDGKTLLTSGFDKVLRLWDVAGAKELKTLRGHVARVEGAAFTPDGKRVISCGDQNDPTLRIWDVATGVQLLQSAETSGGFTSIAMLPNSPQCVTTGKDGLVRLWEWKK